MDLSKLETLEMLIDLATQKKLAELTLELKDNSKITIKPGEKIAVPTYTTPPEKTAAPKAPAANNFYKVTSPMVGTFYRSPSPDSPPFVEVGSSIGKGQTLCIIEAMKLMNELEAEVSGTVRSIRVENGKPVEFGQLLIEIEVSGSDV